MGLGPIAQALAARPFDEAFLISDFPAARVGPYLKWLGGRTAARLTVLPEKLSGPTNFGEIYQAAVRACTRAWSNAANPTSLVLHRGLRLST